MIVILDNIIWQHNSHTIRVISINCAECGCTDEECTNSVSALTCKNCTHNYCCCGDYIHKIQLWLSYARLSKPICAVAVLV